MLAVDVLLHVGLLLAAVRTVRARDARLLAAFERAVPHQRLAVVVGLVALVALVHLAHRLVLGHLLKQRQFLRVERRDDDGLLRAEQQRLVDRHLLVCGETNPVRLTAGLSKGGVGESAGRVPGCETVFMSVWCLGSGAVEEHNS